jgi:FixJ family two-component response regulator
VLLLDDDPDLLEILAGSLHELCGCEAIALGSYGELVRRSAEALACELALLDVNLGAGEPSGADALRWLKQHRFGGRIVFLTGHARSHPLVEEAMRTGEADLLSKPVSLQVLAALVEDAHRSGAGSG